MTTIEEVHSVVLEIQSSLQKILSEKQSLTQSSILGIDDDLIERFQCELLRFQIEDELIPGTYDEELVLNKASYYFEHLDKITNRRAYLTKILSQIPRHAVKITKAPEPEPQKKELSDAEIDELLYKFNGVSDEMIAKIVYENQRVMWLVKGIDRDRYTALHKVVLTQKALKMGLIS